LYASLTPGSVFTASDRRVTPRSRICSFVITVAWKGAWLSGTSPQPPTVALASALAFATTGAMVWPSALLAVCAWADAAAMQAQAAVASGERRKETVCALSARWRRTAIIELVA
jgi:hypothetical protein